MTIKETDKGQINTDGETASAPPPAMRSGTARFGRRKKGKKGPKKGKTGTANTLCVETNQ